MSIESLRDCAVLDGERLKALWDALDRLQAAFDYVLPYVHVDIRGKALELLDQPSGDS